MESWLALTIDVRLLWYHTVWQWDIEDLICWTTNVSQHTTVVIHLRTLFVTWDNADYATTYHVYNFTTHQFDEVDNVDYSGWAGDEFSMLDTFHYWYDFGSDPYFDPDAKMLFECRLEKDGQVIKIAQRWLSPWDTASGPGGGEPE